MQGFPPAKRTHAFSFEFREEALPLTPMNIPFTRKSLISLSSPSQTRFHLKKASLSCGIVSDKKKKKGELPLREFHIEIHDFV